ncbi:Retrovirus-related Pol polyprotein from type-1 retrotransposable element R1 [Araneus ventricosus]|uniref:Retrovirus-related Pol polyprotein from type-1 retrotransposable element R1 n=1 Tax=Araneus ventricosus TaxID=182803 RepID=A0A4Y2JVA5_ARAVE|nr:Retrovirus-related Pol polyprotein from type-1 retrotransposable element R1 [Araneus ventricosus]
MLPSNVLVKGTDEDFKSNFILEALICTGSDVDDIPFVDTCEDSCETLPDLEYFFKKCLELNCFPDSLKIRLVILFHKTDKEKQNIKSYRPISLLTTLGKLPEKLLLQRFNFQLKTKNLQHPLQYGFKEGKSADDALLHVTSLLEQTRRQEKHAVLISLDISGTFESLQYSSIRDRFASLSLFSNISETLLGALRNRKVAMQTSEGTVLREQTQGYPQGSCNGPAFWNIVADEILSVQWPQRVHLQAFADDFAFIVTNRQHQRRAQKAQQIITGQV